jgi:hypothetical protein
MVFPVSMGMDKRNLNFKGYALGSDLISHGIVDELVLHEGSVSS